MCAPSSPILSGALLALCFLVSPAAAACPPQSTLGSICGSAKRASVGNCLVCLRSKFPMCSGDQADNYCTSHPATSTSGAVPAVRGAALNGLLALEDWFFSWPEALPLGEPYPFNEVSSPPGLPQGRRFPSEKLPSALIDPWISEGGLLGTTAARLGANTTVNALTAHRESFITEADFELMAAHGIQHVRLPIGWWTFTTSTLPAEPALISDPCYPNKQFVTVAAPMLESLLAQGMRHGISFLIDMHAMPCGSSDGTYNGVFPEDPVFFSNSSARAMGLGVIRNMMSWYKTLGAKNLGKSIYGFTLLNEPGLGVVHGGSPPPRSGNTGLPDNSIIVEWLAEATGIFKQAIQSQNPVAPLLYLNLHASAFPGADPMGQMGKAAARIGLAHEPWAVLDVHEYFAWDGGGGGIPAANCSTDMELQAFVSHGMQRFISSLKASATANSIANVACSEWSLSLHHTDTIAPCTAPHALAVMHDTQVRAFDSAAVSNFMWGWRMPQGGAHEAMWSLKFHLTGKH